MPPARSSALVVVALALALGCSLDDKHGLTLQIGTASNCVRTSLACGGEVGVFVTDAKTNEVLDTRCISFAADPTMTLEKLPTVLADTMPPLSQIAGGRSIVIEVAAYSPTSGKGCPRFSPDVGGNPAVPSYFGKSAASAAGVAASISVSLSCLPTACLPCTKFAAPTGTDPDGGVADAGIEKPFKTAARLVSSLAAGQIGCLEDGTYAENVTFAKTGTNAGPITLTAAPGAHPVLKGVLTIPDTTDYITIANLSLDGDAATTKSASPLVRGDHVALRGNDITNVGADCVTLGDPTFGVAKLTDIESNRIHGCKAGIVARVAESGEIQQNFIFDNTGNGVALNPNGDSFTVEHDVIDGNGSGFLFGSDGKVVSISNVLRTSIVSNSTVGYDVDSLYPGPVGTGNSATQNCLWMGAKGLVVAPAKGFSVKANITADPMFVDRAAKDFRLMVNSACQTLGPVR
ncbi:MAG TPA: right-handed parallel beta-helix repeat-containing protein [Polyangia bacterium]|jgi:hypothetical protein|nr:right-handed parallel beta-helix repeat-containing protein [Polyangia bacterium]